MNVRSVGTLTVVAAALLLFACPKKLETVPGEVAPARAVPPSIRVPPGCEAPVEGTFVHAQNGDYRYRAQDDGGALLLLVERPTADGGIAPDEDGGTFVLLNRTPNGFTGATEAVVFTQRGVRCRVAFPTDVTSCTDGDLVLRSAASGSVDEQCRAPERAALAARVEHRLVRIALQPQDAGSLDAGLSALVSTDAGEAQVTADAGH